MTTKLQNYFPIIRSREEIKAEIEQRPDLKQIFYGWKVKRQEEFHDYPDIYLHHFEQRSDTGLKIDLLQKFLFVPLDIYQKNQQNKTNNELIESRLDAWLNFFSSSNPEVVIAICEKYPDFKEMYHQIYVICRNLEDVMMMFSEELRQLDNNTARFMIDELQDQMALKDEALDQKVEELAVAFGEIRRKSDELDRTSAKLEQASNELQQKSISLKQMALTMASSGIPLDVIATSANVTIETIQSWLSEQ